MSVSLIDGHIDDDAMTDEQIIKASEYCIIQGITSECERCEVKKGCRSELIANALYLIKRQKAEIERLKAELKEDSRVMKQALVLVDEIKKEIVIDIETARAEAVKEFAKRLTDKADLKVINAFESSWVISQELIDNLVKEMVGEASG